MSRDSVRYGRVPKRPREAPEADLARKLAALPPAPSAPAPAPAPAPEEQDCLRADVTQEIIKAVVMAHLDNNKYTEELLNNPHRQTVLLDIDCTNVPEGGAAPVVGRIIKRAPSNGEEGASSTTDRVTDVRTLLWYNVALRMTPTVQQVVEYAKRLPAFHSLVQDDQLILIKVGFFEIWLARVGRLSTPECIVVDDGTALSMSHLRTLYNTPFAGALLTHMWRLNKLQMTDDEMALYTSTLLYWPHRAGLTEPERIGNLHMALTDAFQSVVMDHPDGAMRLEAFAAAAQEARILSARHHELLAWCRENWKRMLLPALFSEIFDIPKNEDDPNLINLTLITTTAGTCHMP